MARLSLARLRRAAAAGLCVWLGLAGAPLWAQESPTRQTVVDLVGDDAELDRKAAERAQRGWLPGAVDLSYEATGGWRRNLDLDPDRADRRNLIDQELALGVYHRLDAQTSVRLRLKAVSERDRLREDGTPRRESGLARDETWVRWEQVGQTPLSLQLGRVLLSEPRAWWWDDTRDAVRAVWRDDQSFLELAAGREVARVSTQDSRLDPAEQGVWRLFARAGHAWAARHSVEAFLLLADDRSARPAAGSVAAEADADASDARLSWYGLRAMGEHRSEDGLRLRYWADAALLHGRDLVVEVDDGPQPDTVRYGAASHQRIDAYAVDVGATLSAAAPLTPSLTLAWASGSGDTDRGDERDGTFRQTGLQENKVRWRGVTRFRRYGEVLRPELSNLRVASVGLGLKPTGATSVDLIWHGFQQHAAADSLRASRLDADPEGGSRLLGREVDLVIGWRAHDMVDLAVRLGEFRAGRAFGARAGERARIGEITLELSF